MLSLGAACPPVKRCVSDEAGPTAGAGARCLAVHAHIFQHGPAHGLVPTGHHAPVCRVAPSWPAVVLLGALRLQRLPAHSGRRTPIPVKLTPGLVR